MFDVYEGKPSLQYGCNSKDSFVYMPAQSDPVFGRKYTSSLIAVATNSSLLKEAFILLADAIKTGMLPYNS